LVAIPQGEIMLRCAEVDCRQGHLMYRLAHLLQRLPLRELLQDCCCRDDWASPFEDGALALPARQEAVHRRLQLRRRCLDAIYVPIEDTITVLL
jgi:hypothetical protein